METEKMLDSMLSESIDALKSLGIPISLYIAPGLKVNTRAKKRLGCCIYKDGVYTIEVSFSLIKDKAKKNLLQETIYHELLHTCPGCVNHGTVWKRYASLVNTSLGCSIARTVEAQSNGEEPVYPYILRCESCHTEIGRLRVSKSVKYPNRYRCGNCGGKLIRIK